MSDDHRRFQNIRLQEEYDTHDPNGNCVRVSPFLERRSPIAKILAVRHIVFAVAHSGLCVAFSRETNNRLCFLNASPDEVIIDVFNNKSKDALIIVSLYKSENISQFKCRAIGMEFIQRSNPDAGVAVFEPVSSQFPSFFELDDVNDIALAFSANDSVYKVFDLKTYQKLYSISDENIQEVKMSDGIMLLTYEEVNEQVPLKIITVEDATVVKSFNLLHQNKVEFYHMVNEKLLVKSHMENLCVFDVRDHELTEVSNTKDIDPQDFFLLVYKELFLTVRDRTYSVWNFQGEILTEFEDRIVVDDSKNNMYFTDDEDLIILYCEADSDDSETVGNGRYIMIDNMLTGECVGKVNARTRAIVNDRITSSVPEALEAITEIYYHKERNEIYTGNKLGLVHVWSP